jgi:predicted dehydrogenase
VSSPTTGGVSRRDLIKTTAAAAAATAMVGAVPNVFAGEKNTIQVALVGCGGRGTGAATNALATKSGPTKLVAMADVFADNLRNSLGNVSEAFAGQVDVPKERQFVSFDGYKHAMDCLKPGDVVILATPPAFRWVHFTYAIHKGLNVFMEKPVAVDGPSCRRMFKLGEEAQKKNLKVGVGLMCRHCVARQELYNRIQNGEVGDLVLLRAYRMAGPTASAFSTPKPDGISELLYQIRRFHSFLWASGGAFSDFLIHNIDECCWMKGAWPVKAQASGGRHYRGNYIDQNFDVYSTEYTFADGAKLFLEGRLIAGCHQEFASYGHGAKGSAVISSNSHWPSKARIFKGQKLGSKEDVVWDCGKENNDPYQKEWEDLVEAIRNDDAYNEVKRGTEASLVTAMGRMAAHTGRIVTRDEMLNHEHEFAPDVDKLKMDSPAPVQADSKGKYPVPEPGIKTKREY